MADDDENVLTADPPGRDMRCPVCLATPITWPRLYECGHTVCTECHRRWDARTNEQTPTHSMAVYSCPICRAPTMDPWYHRPLNHHMRSSGGGGDEEEEQDPARREQEARQEVVQEARETDLSSRAFDSFSEMSIRMYHRILPRLYEAACAGQMRVEIDNADVVREFQHCFRGVAQLLFENNNIYRFNCLPNEVTILLCPEGQTMTRTLTNRAYRAPRMPAAERRRSSSPIRPTAILPVAADDDAAATTTRLRNRIAVLRSRISGRRSSPPPPPPGATQRVRPPPLRLPPLLRPSDILTAISSPSAPAVGLQTTTSSGDNGNQSPPNP